eukprot:1395500-Heterocapsa_arctica.AAC.1
MSGSTRSSRTGLSASSCLSRSATIVVARHSAWRCPGRRQRQQSPLNHCLARGRPPLDALGSDCRTADFPVVLALAPLRALCGRGQPRAH